MEQVPTGHLKAFGAGEFETFTELIVECAKRERIALASRFRRMEF